MLNKAIYREIVAPQNRKYDQDVMNAQDKRFLIINMNTLSNYLTTTF